MANGIVDVRPQSERQAASQSAVGPFVKWVGGKRSVLPALQERMPAEYGRYVELFLGGGALFFAQLPPNAYLSDINFHLMITYKALQDDVETVIGLLKGHKEGHCEQYYLQARRQLSEASQPAVVAALFIYLNKTCYNGLYRVNKSGKFNVPIGRYKNPNIADEENLRGISRVLKGAVLEQLNFRQFEPQSEDFFYLDPPYDGTYSQYFSKGFGKEEHGHLAKFCDQIDKGQGRFMLSNSDTPYIRQLYRKYRIEVISAARSVSCKAGGRGKENELLIRNY